MQCLNYIRIDERLIHGQVLIKWLNEKESREIVVIDDMLRENPILKRVMEKSLPENCRMETFGNEEGAEYLKDLLPEREPFILARDIGDVMRLEKAGIRFQEINVARMPYLAGKEKICDKVYMNSYEKELIRHFLSEGSSVYIQMVPDSEKVLMKDLPGFQL